MLDCYVTKTDKKVIPIQTIITQDFNQWFVKQSNAVKNWVKMTNFVAKPGTICYVGAEEGDVQTVLLGINDKEDVWSLGYLPTVLNAGIYSIDEQYAPELNDLAAIAWGLGHYNFCRYRSKVTQYEAKLLLPPSSDSAYIENTVEATYLIRDLIKV